MSYLDKIKKFVGIVKIADIQEAFKILIDGINKEIDLINDCIEITTSGVDFSKGSSTLPGYNYTLTIGAFKKILNAYTGNNPLIGGYKIELNGDRIVFPYLTMTTHGIEQTKQHIDSSPEESNYMFVNPSITPTINLTRRSLPYEAPINANNGKEQFLLPATRGRSNGEVGNNYVNLGDYVLQALDTDFRGSRACSAVNYLYTPIYCPAGLAKTIFPTYGATKALYFTYQ